MLNTLKRSLFKLARSRYAQYFIGLAFEYLTPLMPVEKLYNDPYAIAFYHPVPFWEQHVIIVPKKRIPSFTAFDFCNPDHKKMLLSIFKAAQSISRQLELEKCALLVNGGVHQDVPQVHFHLTDGDNLVEDTCDKEVDCTTELESFQSAVAHSTSNSAQDERVLVTTPEPHNPLPDFDLESPVQQEQIFDMLTLCQKIVKRHKSDGYKIVILTDDQITVQFSK